MDLGDFEKSKSNSGNKSGSDGVYKSESGRHLSPGPGASDDEKETEKVKMKKNSPKTQAKDAHLKNRYEVETKIVNEMQVRIDKKQSTNSKIDSKIDSDVELIKQRESIDSKDFRDLARKYKEKGTFHSTTGKGGDTSDGAEDPILPGAGTEHDVGNYTPVFANDTNDANNGAEAGKSGATRTVQQGTARELGLQTLAQQDSNNNDSNGSKGEEEVQSTEVKSGNVNSLHGKGNYEKLGKQSTSLTPQQSDPNSPESNEAGLF